MSCESIAFTTALSGVTMVEIEVFQPFKPLSRVIEATLEALPLTIKVSGHPLTISQWAK